ncbi:EF-hand domain-containing family member B-like [Ylistrum balloti]|uniref:EF-hand domain-containing family member B-like n=1 Tax=Ylistrum balloti TaxID=509963 RepID=UPI0029058750|nr:EF-hand domain-containing family member B-like [Ylistrum balloti]
MSSVTLPGIAATGIYTGKYKDWSPDTRPAGKLTATGDTALSCLKPKDNRPPSADVIRRFRATLRPDAGQMRVFYGKASDPHRQWAKDMCHGINTQSSANAGELANPDPKTLFQQKKLDRKELIYASHLKAPLGTSHNQIPCLPKGLNKDEFTFGIPTELDIGAGGLINPNKTYAEVEKESAVGHELYRDTHSDYDVGEQHHRNYTSTGFNEKSKFGIPTPHSNDGRKVRQTLRWMSQAQQEKATKIVSKRVDDFRERTQPQLGTVHDPIKDTLKVAPDHTFGILVKPDEYGAGDLLHMRPPGTYLRGKDRQRGVMAAIRQHLKKANYHNFHDLLAAFRHYDKDGSGKIKMQGLREACAQYHLPVEPELLEQLMDYCDTNRDGCIDYLEFSNFLNWKDKMPSGFGPKTETPKTPVTPKSAPSPHVRTPHSGSEVQVSQEDLHQKTPQSAESTPRRLQKQIDMAIGNHRTSSSMINAVIGGVDTRDFRRYGVPTIRTDLPGPRIRRVDDRKNYGDESDAYGLMNPSIFSRRGVFEKDFLLPRTLEEIKEIFTNVGVRMTGENVETLYQTAAKQHPKGHVSVESFRGVLDDVLANQVLEGKHPLAI